MATKSDLVDAQEAFYAALKRSRETLADLRKSRTGKRGGTAEMIALESSSSEVMGRVTLVTPTPVPRRKTPSQMRVSAQGMSDNDFAATLLLINRLRVLGEREEKADIVCLDERAQFQNGHNPQFSCKGLQSFWTRTGKEPPVVRYTSAPLGDVLADQPVAIFMNPAKAPEQVRGYIRVVLDEPNVCMFLREH